jgi:hypothetical protein
MQITRTAPPACEKENFLFLDNSTHQHCNAAPFFENSQSSPPLLTTRPSSKKWETKGRGVSFPDSPDRRAMRIHRAAGDMKISQLRRQRNLSELTSTRSTHAAVLDAYGYQAAADTAIALLRTASDFLRTAVSFLPDFQFGPAGAEAAGAGRRTSPRNDRAVDNVAAFKLKFSKDFDIRVSPSLEIDDGLEGVTVVIGEEHHNQKLRSQINQVLSTMDQNRGDFLILEGDKSRCLRTAAELKIKTMNCIAIEENTRDAMELVRLHENWQDAILEMFKLFKEYVPDISWRNLDISDKGIAEFIIANDHRLPKESEKKRNTILGRIERARSAVDRKLDECNDSREKNMMAVILKNIRPGSTNFVILGQAHVQSLAQELYKEKVILMTPHLLYKTYPDKVLPAPGHEEL